MLQIGGAGAQQEFFLEIMGMIDYKAFWPLFAAGCNRKFFSRLIEKGRSLGRITEEEYISAKKGDFRMLDYQEGIMNFSSGLRILYHPEKYKSVEYIDTAKSKNIITVVKPGDVTSAGSLMLFLYHIGGHELENAKWAIRNRIGRWIMEPKEYEEIRASPKLDAEYAKRATQAMIRSVKEKSCSLKELNSRGAYNVASLSLLITLWRKSHDTAKVNELYKSLCEKSYCSLKKTILGEVMKVVT